MDRKIIGVDIAVYKMLAVDSQPVEVILDRFFYVLRFRTTCIHLTYCISWLGNELDCNERN